MAKREALNSYCLRSIDLDSVDWKEAWIGEGRDAAVAAGRSTRYSDNPYFCTFAVVAVAVAVVGAKETIVELFADDVRCMCGIRLNRASSLALVLARNLDSLDYCDSHLDDDCKLVANLLKWGRNKIMDK